jgi:Tol biopolymer transport system component
MRSTDGSPAVHLGDGTGISVSPDAQWVAVTEGNRPHANLVLLPVKAGAAVRIDTAALDPANSRSRFPEVGWFPDGKRVLFTASEAGRAARTYVQDIPVGQPRPLTPEGISGTVMTVDGGSLLVFDSQSNAFLFPLRAGTRTPLPALTPEYRALRFSSDGRSLYVVKRDENPTRIWRIDLGSGRREVWREIPLTEDPAGILFTSGAQITPDGRSVAYSVTRSLSELYVAEGLK